MISRQRRWAIKQRALGCCPQCGQPLTEDDPKYRCNECNRKALALAKRERDRRKQEGTCARCLNKAQPGKYLCCRCAKYIAEHQKKYRKTHKQAP